MKKLLFLLLVPVSCFGATSFPNTGSGSAAVTAGTNVFLTTNNGVVKIDVPASGSATNLTPWISAINGATFPLTNAGYVNIAVAGSTNVYPFNMLDRYGSNLFGFNPSTAGSNYWHLQVGEFTPGHALAQNISDIIFRMTQNGYFQVAFGSVTNSFWSFGSVFSWGDPNGATQDLFDHQARFFPQHIQPNPVNNNTGPGVAVGAAAGSGASVSVTSPNSGTDVAVRVQLTTGSSGLAAGTLLTVTYQLAYAHAPHVVFSASPGSTNAAIASAVTYPISQSTTAFVLGTTTALVASKTYTWDIITIE